MAGIKVAGCVGVAVALAALLSGCKTQSVEISPAVEATATSPAVPAVTVQMTPVEARLEKLAQLGISDLQLSLVDARKHQDDVAAQCYAGLIPIVQGLKAKLEAGASSSTSTPGGELVLVFQKTRDLRGSLSGSKADLDNLRKAVNLACGALQIDIQAGALDPLSLFSGQ